MVTGGHGGCQAPVICERLPPDGLSGRALVDLAVDQGGDVALVAFDDTHSGTDTRQFRPLLQKQVERPAATHVRPRLATVRDELLLATGVFQRIGQDG